MDASREAKLYSGPENSLPLGAKAFYLKAADGMRLRAAIFETENRGGTVILLQGRTETMEKYFETACDLQKRGFSVATLDWRGQGGSERLLPDPLKGHVRDFSDYLQDL